MKVVSEVEVVNADKTIIGNKNAEFKFDPDTQEVTINTPAMFTQPIIKLEDLKKVVQEFEELLSPPTPPTPIRPEMSP